MAGGRRGATVQLMVEVNTEEEWEALLTKKGLIVVDVYSEWCGPCTGMVSNLRKIKLDIGGDFLTLAQAKSDNIETLKRFRNKSEPTWMFIAGGQMVNLMFGANAPRLTKLIITELEKEKAVLAGTGTRETIPFDELTPEEKDRFEKQEAKRLAIEAKKNAELAAIAAEKLQRKIDNLLQHIQDYTVILFMPYAFDEQGESQVAQEVKEKLKDDGYVIDMEKKTEVDVTLIKQLLYEGKQDASEALKEAISKGTCVAWLISRVKAPSAPLPPLDIPQLQLPGTEEEEVETEEEWTDAKDRVVEFVYKELFTVEIDIRKHDSETVEDKKDVQSDGDTEEIKESTVDQKSEKKDQAKVEKKEVSFVEKFSKSEDCPVLWTPQTEKLKAVAILELFPEFAQQYSLPEPEPTPPHMTLIFGIDRRADVLKTVSEYKDQILKMGFFSSSDPEKAVYLAKSPKIFDKVSKKTGNEAIVVVVSHVKSDPLLALSEYSPNYISRSPEEGEKLAKQFFPGKEGEDDEEKVDDDKEEDEGSTLDEDKEGISEEEKKAEESSDEKRDESGIRSEQDLAVKGS